MQIPIYQVDAFAAELFKGNPAAVCPLNEWLDDALMQAIAAENNLSETAFFVGSDGQYDLRWFTPESEVDLCGHATLAAAYVIMNELEKDRPGVRFSTRSGNLDVTGKGNLLSLGLPQINGVSCLVPDGLENALNAKVFDAVSALDLMVRVKDADAVLAIEPDMDFIAEEIGYRGLIVTAKGDRCDFVSRYFGPAVGIPEDPVTGSAHCMLAPYWSQILGKDSLVAQQLSKRGGTLLCKLDGDRVLLTGEVAPYMQGLITI